MRFSNHHKIVITRYYYQDLCPNYKIWEISQILERICAFYAEAININLETPAWASEGGAGGPSPLDFIISAKKVFFLVSSGLKQISPLLAPSRKDFGKIFWCPPEKNLSDAHEHNL